MMSWFDFVSVEITSLFAAKFSLDENDGYNAGSSVSSML